MYSPLTVKLNCYNHGFLVRYARSLEPASDMAYIAQELLGLSSDELSKETDSIEIVASALVVEECRSISSAKGRRFDSPDRNESHGLTESDINSKATEFCLDRDFNKIGRLSYECRRCKLATQNVADYICVTTLQPFYQAMLDWYIRVE